MHSLMVLYVDASQWQIMKSNKIISVPLSLPEIRFYRLLTD